MNQIVNGMCSLFENPFLSYEEMGWQQPDLTGTRNWQVILGGILIIPGVTWTALSAIDKVALPLSPKSCIFLGKPRGSRYH